MKQHLFTISIAAITLLGCAETLTAAEPPPAREISREVAVTTARDDAAHRFRLVAPASVVAQRVGRYWLIDLRAEGGGGLHYAIATDGTIRERRTSE